MPQRPQRMSDAEFHQLVEEAKARFNITDIARRRATLKPVAGGREHVSLCFFHNEKTPSLRFNDTLGTYFCFGCGCSGDVIRFVMETEKLRFMDAVRWLAGSTLPRVSPEERIRQRQEEEAERLAAITEAVAFWKQCRVPRGTPAEHYARTRGITMELPRSIRFGLLPVFKSKKDGKWGKPMPCLVGCVQGGDGQILGIQRTFLAAGGERKANMKKPKLSLGRIVGGAVRLAAAQEEITVCEGWEDGQTLMQEGGPGRAVWVATGTGLLPHIQFPEVVKRVVIASQNNRAASIAAAKAAQAYVERGLRVFEIRPNERYDDWNDQLLNITIEEKKRRAAADARRRASQPKGRGNFRGRRGRGR